MLSFIARRLLQAIPVLLAIYTLTFFMVRLSPGSPFSDERKVADHIIEAQNAYFGYDDPLHIQYLNLLWRHLTFDFPPLTSQPGLNAGEIIAESFPVSLELGLWSLAIALLLGVPVGIVAAARKNKLLDYGPMSLAMLGICLPTFVIGPLLALVFGVWLQWTSVSGWSSFGDRLLPSLTLGLFYAAYIARLTRGGMLEILSSDFVRTARAKGASERRTIVVHALRGGVLPVISFLGPALAGLVTGSFVVETIFQVPGLGRHFVNAALNKDLALILSTVLFYAVLILIANLVVDIVLRQIDPRQK